MASNMLWGGTGFYGIQTKQSAMNLNWIQGAQFKGWMAAILEPDPVVITVECEWSREGLLEAIANPEG